jgi:hypothetical protein
VRSGIATVALTTYVGTGPANALWVAYQDGPGAWQPLQGTNGSYSFAVTAARYGVAIVCTTLPDDVRGLFIQATPAELPELVHVCPELSWPSEIASIRGALTGIGSGDQVQLATGADLGQLVSPPTQTGSPYNITNRLGTYDLLAARMTGAFQTGVDRTLPVSQILIQRDLPVLGEVTLDIDLAGAPETVAKTLRIDGAGPGETVLNGAVFFTERSASLSTHLAYGAALTYRGIPDLLLRAGDGHLLFGTAEDTVAGTKRQVSQTVHGATDIRLTLPLAFTSPSVSAGAPGPYLLPRASFGAAAGANAYLITYRQKVAGIFPHEVQPMTEWRAIVTPGSLTEGTQHLLPDLSGVSGWSSNWSFGTAAEIEWEVGAWTTNLGARLPLLERLVLFGALESAWPLSSAFPLPLPLPSDGLVTRLATKRGSLTP